jgi:hypothetical protein
VQVLDLFPTGDPFSISPLYQFGTGDALNAFYTSNTDIFGDQDLEDPEVIGSAAHMALRQMESQSNFLSTLLHSLEPDAQRWLLTEPSITKFDRTIINHFLTIFMREVPPTLSSFENWAIQSTTSAEEMLSMAAMGGLYSTTSGSQVVAAALCNDARRLLLTRVSSLTSFSKLFTKTMSQMHTDFPEMMAQKISLMRSVRPRDTSYMINKLLTAEVYVD